MAQTIHQAKKAARQREREIRQASQQVIDAFVKKKKKKDDVPESAYAAQMADPANVVEFDNLKTYFYTDIGVVKAVDGVSFSVPMGKTIGLVGESGCGKSVTSLSLMRLLQEPVGQIAGGQIRYNDGKQAVDIAKLPEAKMRAIRGNEISMIFQEPMTSLNPVFTIGSQIDEAIKLHNPKMSDEEIQKRAIALIDMVGISRAEGIYRAYPHELSGGMRQRIMIAMALSCNPRLIIADEPTTALDVTIQAQILDLLRNLKDKINASIMLITHDLGVVAEMADIVVVMYAGRIIEQGPVREVFHNPRHPYTIGLLESKPVLNRAVDRLYSIPGQVPNPINMPACCYFKDRCDKCVAACDGAYPAMRDIGGGHWVSCYLYGEGESAHE